MIKMFKRVLQNSKKLSSEHFSISMSGIAKKFIIVVPKRIARLSVIRHHNKRQITEALKEIFNKDNVPNSYAVVSVRASLYGVHYQEMKKELTNLFLKLPT